MRDETGYLRSRGQGSLESPLHVLSQAYLGLSFHSLIKPFPFLVDGVVQNPVQWQLQGDQITRGLLIMDDSKGLRVLFLKVYRILFSNFTLLAFGRTPTVPVGFYQCVYWFMCLRVRPLHSQYAEASKCFHTTFNIEHGFICL